MKWKPDWFLLGMIAATALAWAWPAPGAAGGWLHPGLVTKGGVALIFFLHGVLLSFGAMRAGALNWRLHAVVQGCTFLFFPLLGLALYAGLGDRVSPELKIGLVFLCALPSTVSSSVAMTATARGNVAGAVFNATLSSLLGVFLTPLWIALVLQTSGQTQPLGPVILDLLRWLVLPLAVGQALHPWLGPTPSGTNRWSTWSIAARFCCWFTRRSATRFSSTSGRGTARRSSGWCLASPARCLPGR
jgi:sodium/bile acid cotransporter 7